ncbi:MAG: NAD-dependent epimerase/dehydratase family protein [Candidatus Komeilibacteria bacterium]|nr:NAD-dependent epimerase/dehydratase family protein [Candidatus Komeilibacteria bacterium]
MTNIKGVFEKKNVVVTGGAGFVGSHICEELLKTGEAQVICIDSFISGSELNIDSFLQLPNFKFIKQDIIETINLASFPELAAFQIEFQGIQEIYHCASPTSYKDPKKFALQTALTNTRGTKNVLDVAKQYQAKLVHLSSSAIYGDPMPENKFFKEDYWGFVDPLGERASYNESKRYAETICDIYRQSEGVDVKIARIFSTYGPRMKMAEGRMIPDFIGNALDNKDIVIYGDQDTKSSYCYVKDTVDALFKLMASKETGPINIGNDTEYKIADIAAKIIKIINSKSKIVFENPLASLQVQGLPDIRLAKERISWFPMIGLDKGLEETIRYIESVRFHYEQKGLWQMDTPV